MEIEHTLHKDIDKSRWDKTISLAFNGILYPYSWYLDVVCPGWDALISPDYGQIMPLTGKKKFGFYYIFRPLLCQQLGLFSLSKPTTVEIGSFLASIPPKYRLVQSCLNEFSMPSGGFTIIKHDTYELSLNPGYEQISKEYGSNHRRNIKKADSSGLSIIENLNHGMFFEMLARDNSPGSKILSDKNKSAMLKNLVNKMEEHGKCKVLGIKNSEGKTIAGVLFGYSHKKWIYLVPVNSTEGKEKRALFAIIDHLIHSRSGKDEVLDFEGSDIPGLAQFYSGFGAKKHLYSEIRRNTLPWPIKYLK